jgi:hypothetical protein
MTIPLHFSFRTLACLAGVSIGGTLCADPIPSPQPTLAPGRFALESPAPGSHKSGIGLVRGWVCDAREVSVSFNYGTPKPAVYGNPRGDTRSICGDVDNGFELLWAWSLLGDGIHSVQVYADGLRIADVNFSVATLGFDAAYVTNLTGDYVLDNFPLPGEQTTIGWSTEEQNFVIKATTHIEDALPEYTPDYGAPVFSYGVPGNPGGFTASMLIGKSLYSLLYWDEDVAEILDADPFQDEKRWVVRYDFHSNFTVSIYHFAKGKYHFWKTIPWHINKTGGLLMELEEDDQNAYESICHTTNKYISVEAYGQWDYGDLVSSTEFNQVYFFKEADAISYLPKLDDLESLFAEVYPHSCTNERYQY